jgi:hypothetical protein
MLPYIEHNPGTGNKDVIGLLLECGEWLRNIFLDLKI